MRKQLTATLLTAALLLCAGIPPRALASAVYPNGAYIQSDVADAAQEENRLPSEPVPEYVAWLLETAAAELGYTEGSNNLTKYGKWAGDPNAAWCAEFLCWCVDQVDILHGTSLLREIYPMYSGQNTGRDWFVARGRFVFRRGNCPDWGYQWLLGKDTLMKKNEYIPRPGDWVFFSYNLAGDTEHVAMIEYTSKDEEGNIVLHVLEGNNPSSVQRNRYYLNNSQVLGFGTPVKVAGTTIRSGNRGDAVLALQQDLYALGFLEERHLTGAFGGHTKSAVTAFQKTIDGKTPNGIADMETQITLANRIALATFNANETWLVVD